MDQLAHLQDLISQKKKEPVNLEKALEVVVGEYLERHDPVRKADRAMKRKEDSLPIPPHTCAVKLAEPPEGTRQWFVRQGMKSFLKHQVMDRDRGRCTYVYSNGQRCKEQRFLEMHHLHAVSRGGADTLENLTLLCSSHHKHMHLKMGKRRSASTSIQSVFWQG